ncbi:MAG: PEP-CTERM sorting domain-containing protein [Chthoniobacterales bacterium]
MIKSTPKQLIAIAAVSLLAFSLTAQANHIDFLDEGPFNFSGVTSPTTIAGIPTASTLGGQRMMSIVTLSGNPANLTASLNPVNPAANDDFMVFSALAGSSGRFTLAIGAAAPLNANFLDIPMGGGNQWDRVRLTFDPSVMSSLSPVITVTLMSSTAGGSATVTQAFAGGMGGNVDFLHSAFTANNPAFTGAAFRDIDMATFSITGIDGGVYNIASFDRNGLVLIPEPSTYALLAVGLVGAVVMARRRKVSATA